MNENAPKVAVRDAMLAQSSSRPLLDALESLNLSSIELELDRQLSAPAWKLPDGIPVSLATPAERAVARKLLADRGISICAVLLMSDFPANASAAADSEGAINPHVQWAIDAVTVADELGAPAVRIDPLTANRNLPAESVRATLIHALQQILDATHKSRVDLAIENHGAIGNAPEFIDAVFAAVPDPRVGLALDPGNFYWFGTPISKLYALIERYAPRARHTHIKNINYTPALANTQREIGLDYKTACGPIDEGNIDYAKIVAILKDAGFTRALCIENESLGRFGQPEMFGILKRDVKAVERAIGANR